MWVVLPIIGLFIILGITFRIGRGASLIAGYNTMSEADKAEYDTSALLKFMGNMMFILSFSQILSLVGDLNRSKHLLYLGFLLFFVTMIFMLIFMNTDNRFKKLR
ncbi:MAG TPA: DUF3784 domain-containing protein [Pseudogracilibacillus sp.]|nr:DUF3784 domain-containing protein [Pseudogracilibacillus sp.]